LKKRILIMTIVLFSLLQAANLVCSFLNDCYNVTEMVMENEDAEKSCKEDYQPNEWNVFLITNFLPNDFSYRNKQSGLSDINPSKSYLTKPETPPPDIA
jgi:hypothetical protein